MITSISEKCSVLIVDDDRKVADLLTELLEQEGYEVVSADNGISALEVLNSSTPDLVISDVVMPGLDGIQLCRHIKKDPLTANTPVLLISGLRNSPDDSIEGLTAGADDYLAVPFRHEELLVKVARLAERHRVEEHYRGIVEHAADIIFTRNRDGYITSINAAGGRFFGKPAAQIVGRHLSTLIGSEAAARDVEQTMQLAPDSPLRSTYYLKDAENQGRYLEAVLTIERDRQGQATDIRAVVRDITEQKLAVEGLQESEERYRRLVELSPEPIMVHSAGRIVYVNTAAQRLWGASSPEELLNKPILDIVHPDYRDSASRRIKDIYESGSPSPAYEVKHVRLNGDVIDVEVAGMPFVFGGQPAVQAVIRDVTDRQRGREALRQTEERLRTVVSSASLILFALDRNGVFT
ncbi:MAG TPA: PAS domain S-box protein, partial [Pyrinomonadaceae bacterium]|nr:PAS domain S-box protein [Pyrinomonadaceae bacterium]